MFRRIRKFAGIAVLALFLPSLAYGAVANATGFDPLDLIKDEVPEHVGMPGYEIVHDPALNDLVIETKAVEPDHGWDTQWILDGVDVRFREVGEGLEVEFEGDTGETQVEVTDTLQDVLVAHGFDCFDDSSRAC
jgi:hypothetical protein